MRPIDLTWNARGYLLHGAGLPAANHVLPISHQSRRHDLFGFYCDEVLFICRLAWVLPSHSTLSTSFERRWASVGRNGQAPLIVERKKGESACSFTFNAIDILNNEVSV